MTYFTAAIDSSTELEIVDGVDTHADIRYESVLSATGTLLGALQVLGKAEGYEQLLAFIRSSGSTRLVDVEGTSSCCAGLVRYVMSQGVEIREVVRPRRVQRRHGKSDPFDAYAAAVRAPAEPEALLMAKTGDGGLEHIRVLLGVRRSATKARVAVIRQSQSMLITSPQAIGSRWEGLN